MAVYKYAYFLFSGTIIFAELSSLSHHYINEGILNEQMEPSQHNTTLLSAELYGSAKLTKIHIGYMGI